MAAALLGKCIGLLVPVLLVLLYTCCYGFRIREHPASTASNSALVEEHSSSDRATCDSDTISRCQQDRSSPFSSARRWHDATASTRILAKRKPPVEVTSREHREEEASVRLERIARSTVGVVDQDDERESDEDDDDDEAVVEVEDSRELIVDSADDEQTSEDKEDDQEDEEHEDRKTWKSKLTTKKDKGRQDSGVRRKETRPFKELKRSKDEDEGDDDDEKQEKSKLEADDEEEDEEKTESKDEEEDEESDEESEEEPEVTSPPVKLEKVRFADKDKVKSVEVPSSIEKPKEIKKPAEKKEEPQKVETKKPVEPPKKTESPRKPAETPKKVEPARATKPEAEPSKSKATPKPEMKETAPPKVPPTREKVPTKVEDKGKQQMKTDATKAKPKDQQVTQPEKKKVESASPKFAPPAKPAEVKRLDKDDSKDKTKARADTPFTLPELNDALLRLPTFVPNFTAVEDFECQQHGKIFLRQLRGRKLWALQMLDSSAKIPPGILRGNVNQLGDFDECMGVMAHVKLNNSTIKVQGKYCLADVDFYASHPDMRHVVNLMQARSTIRSTMRDPGHFVPRSTTASWGICIPAACSAESAKGIVEQALSPFNSTTGITFNVGVNPRMCYTKQKPESYSKETIGVLYFYAMIICLAVVATVRDYLVVPEGKGSYSERIIMAFSVKRTLKSLFKRGTSNFDISCIHGLRAIGAILLYMGHKFVPVLSSPYSNRIDLLEVMSNPVSILARASFIYTEWFLLFSGTLTAYNMAYEYTNRGEIRWFCRLVTRYVRLTPVLLAVVFYYAFVMEHTGSGPYWNNIVMRNVDICKNTGWINLLYLQNTFNFEDMCATHTHQLAVDMQLTFFAPILVFFLQFKTIIGILLICFFILLAATLRYIRTMSYNLSLIFYHGVTIRQLYRTANLTYITPLHRTTSYVIGVGFGVLLHYTKRDLKMNKVVVILGWLIATGFGLWTIVSPWQMSNRDYVYDVEELANYGVMCPILGSIALCWIIFACHTNYGGIINKILTNQWLLVISRISYALYMTQFAVFFYNVGSTRYTNEFTIIKGANVLETTIVVIIAIVVTLLFDIPMQEFKNVITECTDTHPRRQSAISDKPSETSKIKDDKEPKQPDNHQEEGYEEDEVTSTGWDWQRDIVHGGTKMTETVEDEEQVDIPILKRSSRRKSFMSHDSEGELTLPMESAKDANRRYPTSDDGYKQRRRSRSVQRDYPDSEPEEVELSELEQEEAVFRGRRSMTRSFDRRLQDSDEEQQYLLMREREEPRHYRRSESRGRSAIRDVDDHRSPNLVSRERSSSRGPEHKRLSSRSEELEPAQRQIRSLSRSSDPRRAYSSESEEELSQRRKLERRTLPAESRISDEEDWESELRMRRKQFMEKLATQERESVLEDEDLTSLRRRSSAEGKMALLKDPSADDNMDSWTVSVGSRVAQLGSSQEPSEPEEDSGYRRRREYREQAPPPGDDNQSEEEAVWDASRRSYTSSSQITSVEEDEDDLSKLSQEEADLSESGWNIVKESADSQPKGLYKRESIIKSQASEEDPEYLLPERPKLVQQEREHPFKKAWQMQKSRSEEDAYVIREIKDQTKMDPRPKNEEAPNIKREHSGEQSSEYEDVGSYAEDIGAYADDESESVTLSRSRSTDTEENRTRSKSEETASTDGRSREGSKANSRSDFEDDSSKMSWPAEEEQFGRRTVRSKSEETDWTWEEEET
ncbi:uncharacterized protein LOC143355219 isoform X2 [Halictus rubicundus]|uniref:uncharacterized protein LOC143355219 isoform X2 n=1 Tax=Halictus rubicundus TaxID=77578 RepID=UPI004036A168